jgi:phosphatidylglycerophosphate synthase
MASASMSKVWAEIDARRAGAVDASMFVGGLPLVSRQVRQLARTGYGGARIVCDEAGRSAIERALSRRPGPAGFPVELAAAPSPDAAVRLRGTGLYKNDVLAAAAAPGGPAPEPYFVVTQPADRREGLRQLFATLGKNIERDGVFCYYVTRPISRVFARGFLPTPISPNQVTILALLCGVVAAGFLFAGGRTGATIAGALLIVGMFLDNVDGDLARLRLQFSRLGEWLDSIGDEIVTLSVTSAVGLGLAREGASSVWPIVSLSTAGIGLFVIVQLYAELARRGGPIDTAVYPWFFREDLVARSLAGADAAKLRAAQRDKAKGLGAWASAALDFLFRRDVYITIVAVLLIADQRKVALLILLAGVSGLAVMFFVHKVVMGLRRLRKA